MIEPIYLDTETCGFHGPIVLIQFAKGDGPIEIIDVWKKRVYEVINLIEAIVNNPDGVIGFNLAFDWFHLVQMYTTLCILEPLNYHARMEDVIDDYFEKEPLARDSNICLKPYHAHDVMLYARKTSYQNTMDRKAIRIKRVPTVLAYQLRAELEKRISIKDIYFAKKKSGEKWKVQDIEKNEHLKNLVLDFAPSSALKALAADALNIPKEEILKFDEISSGYYPKEYSFAPFGKAVENKYESWYGVIRHHIEWWLTNRRAREYAAKDVEYTRRLYDYFGRPDMDDDDSTLSCLVAAVRWKGFAIDIDKIKILKAKAEGFANKYASIARSPNRVKRFLRSVMSEEEQIAFDSIGSTKKTVLKNLIITFGKDHEVSKRAKIILEARDILYDINIYDKLLLAGRLHANVKVIGTLSGRTSGGSLDKDKKSLNVHGIKRTKSVRSCFPLAFPGFTLGGGDFSAFEVSLACAAYDDPKLTNDLTKCYKCGYNYKPSELLYDECPSCKQSHINSKGEKESTRQAIHALFAMKLYPGNSYQDVLNSKGTKSDSMYDIGKNGVFSMIYGGDKNTLINKYGIEPEAAEKAEQGFLRDYPYIAKARKETKKRFCSMTQPDGIGTKVVWVDPDEYIESMLGFRRYFTLENMICKALFDLANRPPPAWLKIRIPIVRRNRQQYVAGATQSALYASAFNIQSHNMRAAENHRIQATGAQITKTVEVAIWELQPKGINEWIVIPLNIHDEIMVPTRVGYENEVKEAVTNKVESFRNRVPLIAMDWQTQLETWADK